MDLLVTNPSSNCARLSLLGWRNLLVPHRVLARAMWMSFLVNQLWLTTTSHQSALEELEMRHAMSKALGSQFV